MSTVNQSSSAADSRSLRAEQALRTLHQRIERHTHQEVRLERLYQGWQDGWSAQYDQLHSLLSRLEAHLSTWMRHAEPAPVFSVVSAHDYE